VEGAKEVGVEIHSMSKGFNMIGWRMAFVAGIPPSSELSRRERQLRFGTIHGDSASGATRCTFGNRDAFGRSIAVAFTSW